MRDNLEEEGDSESRRGSKQIKPTAKTQRRKNTDKKGEHAIKKKFGREVK